MALGTRAKSYLRIYRRAQTSLLKHPGIPAANARSAARSRVRRLMWDVYMRGGKAERGEYHHIVKARERGDRIAKCAGTYRFTRNGKTFIAKCPTR